MGEVLPCPRCSDDHNYMFFAVPFRGFTSDIGVIECQECRYMNCAPIGYGSDVLDVFSGAIDRWNSDQIRSKK